LKRSDNIRDYATSAFIKYYRLGCPTRTQREEQIRAEVFKKYANLDPKLVVTYADAEIHKNRGHLDDIDAVNRMFDVLSTTPLGEDIALAVREVYFFHTADKITVKKISLRVRYHAGNVPCDERTVYRWLKAARELFAVLRGLDVTTEEDYGFLRQIPN
jgi:hypothetical protein